MITRRAQSQQLTEQSRIMYFITDDLITVIIITELSIIVFVSECAIARLGIASNQTAGYC